MDDDIMGLLEGFEHDIVQTDAGHRTRQKEAFLCDFTSARGRVSGSSSQMSSASVLEMEFRRSVITADSETATLNSSVDWSAQEFTTEEFTEETTTSTSTASVVVCFVLVWYFCADF